MLDMGYMQHLVENSYDYHNTGLQVPSVGEMEVVAMNEATYYGKNKKLLEVEKILDEMRVEAGDYGTGSTTFGCMMEDVGNRLAELFGFKSLLINCSICDIVLDGLFTMAKKGPVQLMSPGYTYCHTSIYKYTQVTLANGKIADLVTVDDKHKGVQFDPKFNYVMRMGLGAGLFVDRGSNSFTGAEILAIILHEIGHNFYIGPVREISAEAISLMTINDITTMISSMVMLVTIGDIMSVVDDNLPDGLKDILRSIKNTAGPIYNMINKIAGLLRYPAILLSIPARIALIIASIPKELPVAWLKYDSEKYSDAFATSYGYGAELASGLIKLSNAGIPSASSKMNDLASIPFGILQIAITAFNQFIDPHPNNMGRLNNNIKYLEAAGKRPMSPALKKEYDKALQNMYDLRDECNSYVGVNINKIDNRYHLWLQNLTRITDIKDITSSFNIFKKYKNIDFD